LGDNIAREGTKARKIIGSVRCTYYATFKLNVINLQKKSAAVLQHSNPMLWNVMYKTAENKRNINEGDRVKLKSILWSQLGAF
jgi:hypothetical protein